MFSSSPSHGVHGWDRLARDPGTEPAEGDPFPGPWEGITACESARGTERLAAPVTSMFLGSTGFFWQLNPNPVRSGHKEGGAGGKHARCFVIR